MKNNERDVELIMDWVKNLKGVSTNPGPLGPQVANMVDNVFVLIPKETLPEVTFGSLDDAFGGGDYARTKNTTETTFDGNFKKMREIGLQYLVMADYVEAKGVKEQIDAAKARRFKVFRELFPESECTLDKFHWSSLKPFEQTVIDKMVLLKMELDKSF